MFFVEIRVSPYEMGKKKKKTTADRRGKRRRRHVAGAGRRFRGAGGRERCAGGGPPGTPSAPMRSARAASGPSAARTRERTLPEHPGFPSARADARPRDAVGMECGGPPS